MKWNKFVGKNFPSGKHPTFFDELVQEKREDKPAAASKVEDSELLSLMQKAYGPIPRSVIPPDDSEPEPPQLEPRDVTIAKPTPTEKVCEPKMLATFCTSRFTPYDVLSGF